MPEYDSPVGKTAFMLRHERRESLRQVARRAGMSPTHLSRIERGKASPTVGILNRLSQALEVPHSTLFGKSLETSTDNRISFLESRVKTLEYQVSILTQRLLALEGYTPLTQK